MARTCRMQHSTQTQSHNTSIIIELTSPWGPLIELFYERRRGVGVDRLWTDRVYPYRPSREDYVTWDAVEGPGLFQLRDLGKGVWGCVRECEGVWGCVRVCEGVWGCVSYRSRIVWYIQLCTNWSCIMQPKIQTSWIKITKRQSFYVTECRASKYKHSTRRSDLRVLAQGTQKLLLDLAYHDCMNFLNRTLSFLVQKAERSKNEFATLSNRWSGRKSEKCKVKNL